MSCLLLARDAHGFLRRTRLCVGVRVLQRQERVGGDGALALTLSAGKQVGDGQLSVGERQRGNLRLQLLEVLLLLLLLHQLEEKRLLLLVLRQSEGRRDNNKSIMRKR